MPKKQQLARQKHIPERTCVACRAGRPKRDLVRVVRTQEGGVEVDETSKKAGRGAYLCRCRTCWEQAMQKNLLDRSLKTALSSQDRQSLANYCESLPESLPSGPDELRPEDDIK